MSIQVNWDSLYERAVHNNRANLESVPGVVLGFHSTIDGMKRVNPAEIEKILAEDSALAKEVISRLGTIPAEIRTPADLLVGLLNSLQNGKALQLMIREETTYTWIMEHLGYDNIRMGGTSGNMANSLAPLPLPRILVYANPLTKEQAELFVPSDNLFVINPSSELKRLARGGYLCHPLDLRIPPRPKAADRGHSYRKSQGKSLYCRLEPHQ